MKTRSTSSASGSLRAALLLFGSYTFAYSVLVAIHETGHLLALRSYGVTDVRIVLHPFTGSRTIWNATDAFIGKVDAAGPLAAIMFGAVVSLSLWKLRRPALLPLLLLGPVACLTEGVSNFMQIVLRSPGSDAMRIVEAGVPAAVVATVAVLIFLVGVVVLVRLLPLTGLSPDAAFPGKALVVSAGLGGFMLAGSLYGAFIDRSALERNGPQLIFVLLMGLMIAAIYRSVSRLVAYGTEGVVTQARWMATWIALSLGVVAVVAQFAAL